MANDDLRRAFGHRLRQARETAGLTQTELGAKMGVTCTAVSYWETAYREPSLHTIVTLAGVLDTTLVRLLGNLESDGDAQAYDAGFRAGWQACARRVMSAAAEPEGS